MINRFYLANLRNAKNLFLKSIKDILIYLLITFQSIEPVTFRMRSKSKSCSMKINLLLYEYGLFLFFRILSIS